MDRGMISVTQARRNEIQAQLLCFATADLNTQNKHQDHSMSASNPDQT